MKESGKDQRNEHNTPEDGRDASRPAVSMEPNSGERQKIEKTASSGEDRPLGSSRTHHAGVSADPRQEIDGEEIEAVLEGLPEDKREVLEQTMIEISARSSSPVPPPSFLEGYNAAMPDGAQQLMDLTRARQEAQIRESDAAIEDNHKNTDADAFAVKHLTFSAAWFPWLLAASGFTLLVRGVEVAGYISLGSAIGVGGIPRVVEALRRKK